MSILQDITERKRAEEAVRESEERYRQLVETSPDAIFVHSDRKFVFVNPATVEVFGAASPEELLGRPIRDIVHPDYWKIIEERDQHIEQRGEGVGLLEEKLLRLDGTPIYVEAAGTPFTYQGKPAVQVCLRDITDRMRAERLLQALNRAALAMERAFTTEEIFAAVAGEFKNLGLSCTVFLTDESQSRLFPKYLTYETTAIKAAEKLAGGPEA